MAQQGPIVVTTGREASSAVVRLVEMSTEQAERLVNEATEDANRIREEANRAAHQVTTDARTRAERVESEARVNAERLHADAMGRAEKLDREIESRRGEMFGDLEKQRDELTATVTALRTFEASYRTNLTNHLRSQIETLESGRAEPEDPPEIVARPAAGGGHHQAQWRIRAPMASRRSGTRRRPSAAARAVTPRGWMRCWETSASTSWHLPRSLSSRLCAPATGRERV